MKETKKMNLICRYIPSRYFESTINDGFLFSDYNNWKYEEDEKGRKPWKNDGCDYTLMKEYQDRKWNSDSKLGVLCFSGLDYEFSQWVIYGDKCDGVCFVFRKDALESILVEKFPSYRFESVRYVARNEMDEVYSVEDLPFLKRKGFASEDEKRLLVEFPQEMKELRLSFRDDEWVSAIERIKIGSAVNEEREIEIRALSKEKGIAVTSSRVNEYESWSKAVVSRVK